MELRMNLPQNCTVINEEEMMYLDGGDATNFAKNIYGVAQNAAIRFRIVVLSHNDDRMFFFSF